MCAQQIDGRVYGVTGGGQGLGLVQAQFLAEQGAHGMLHSRASKSSSINVLAVFAIDRTASPSEEFRAVQLQIEKSHAGTLNYFQADVRDAARQDTIFEEVAAKHGRMDGLVSAAAIQNVTRVMDYPTEEISKVRTITPSCLHVQAN